MRKLFFILIAAALLASCGNTSDTVDTGDVLDPPLPEGVYIAGFFNDGRWKWEDGEKVQDNLGCYWTGNKRKALDAKALFISSISVSDGKVLAGHLSGYWVDGIRLDIDSLYDKLVMSGGKIYTLGGKIYTLEKNGLLVDEVDMVFDRSFSRAYDIAVHGGKVYVVVTVMGYNVGYFIDGVYKFISYIPNNPDLYHFTPQAITVSDDGAVYIAGYSTVNGGSSPDKYWYYTGGEFIELQEFDGEIKRVTVSDGKVYVFTKNNFFSNPARWDDAYYWVDGEKVTVSLDWQYHETVLDIAVFGGKLYMAGRYFSGKPNATDTTACYWADGERYDLNGSVATAIFVAE